MILELQVCSSGSLTDYASGGQSLVLEFIFVATDISSVWLFTGQYMFLRFNHMVYFFLNYFDTKIYTEMILMQAPTIQ